MKYTLEERKRIQADLKPKVDRLRKAWYEDRMRTRTYLRLMITVRELEEKYDIKLAPLT